MPRNLTEAEIAEICASYPPVDPGMVQAYLTRIPASWALMETVQDGAAFRRGYINVIASLENHDDHHTWIHVSAVGLKNAPNSWFLPDWGVMKRVKHDFIGPDRWAYSVLPDDKHYVNLNPYCLHLYARLDGGLPLPDFTRGCGRI